MTALSDAGFLDVAGQSQSASRLYDYVNDVQARADVIDGFLIHGGGQKTFKSRLPVPVLHQVVGVGRLGLTVSDHHGDLRINVAVPDQVHIGSAGVDHGNTGRRQRRPQPGRLLVAAGRCGHPHRTGDQRT